MVTCAALASTPSEPGTPERSWRDRDEWQLAHPLAVPATGGDTRLVVVAAHPGDETLAAGGLLALAARAGLEVVVLLLTGGEASHPHSPTDVPGQPVRRRTEGPVLALHRLAPSGTVQRLGLPEGSVGDHEDAVVTALVDLLGQAGSETLLVAPWRDDGHADHDAAGRAAAVAARRCDATLWEYPMASWQQSDPAHAPWADFHLLPLSDDVRESKEAAVRLHRTQLATLSVATGDEAVPLEGLLAHFRRPFEVFLRLGVVPDDSLDRLHESVDDPWQVRTSWYEQRKRLVTLAALPHPRYGRALEVGGSVGALAAELSLRCDELVVVDESAAATATARASLASDGRAGHGQDLGEVSVLRASVPEEWPSGCFDLVVVSEVGYFLSPDRLRRLVARVAASLGDDGVVLLCHWRHPVSGWPLDGARVHEIWREESALPVVATHVEADFRLDVLSRTSAHLAAPL